MVFLLLHRIGRKDAFRARVFYHTAQADFTRHVVHSFLGMYIRIDWLVSRWLVICFLLYFRIGGDLFIFLFEYILKFPSQTLSNASTVFLIIGLLGC